ncbi:D-alanyl-D-alanine carboxypeptidase family protein [Caldalkalibacillus salinus]|uniref:D-alanyl-D-alanine carboxypeptidase family protein n=1 Tax=Caldalkalibacillus salinus TaxID=2803787 RepID=UPI001F36B5E8|nr:D-alanyl-D-alanine carboxypeptidase family protein [Caldalkalibacillus salinus]
MKRHDRVRSRKRRYLMILLSCILLFTAQPHIEANKPFEVSGHAAILMDVESGRILYEKNIDEQMRIASITKIMTAIIAIEQGVLDDKVETTSNAYKVEGSSIYLKLGEKLTLEEMLYGLMLRSGNDAAVAIAEHIGGSVEGFAFLMNQKAAELGMSRSVFNNPHGLDSHEEHYSTARDMALLTAYAMKNETFSEIVKSKHASASLEGESWNRSWRNKNKLLRMYPYADGVKTGYTQRAGRTLVSSATKDGHRLVAVTLNASDDWNDHMRMFEYGFEVYDSVPLAIKGEEIEHRELAQHKGTFKVMNDLYYPLSESEDYRKRIAIHPAFESEKLESIPYPAGYIHYFVGEHEVGRVPVVYTPEKPTPGLWQHLKNIFLLVAGGLGG